MKRCPPLEQFPKGSLTYGGLATDKVFDLIDQYNACAVPHNNLVTTLENRMSNLGK